MKFGNKKQRECFVLIINLVLAVVAMSVLIGLQTPSVWAEDPLLLEPTDASGATDNLGSNVPNPSGGEDASKFGLSWFFKEPSGIGQGFAQGAVWAVGAYMAIQYIGPMIGLSDPMTEALQSGAAAGLGTAAILRGLSAGGTELSFLTAHPFLSGLVIGAVVFLLTYKEESYKTYTFECQPWEAPLGGDDCELCNDEAHACSEYRCKSLGQACELENAGTGYELCYNAHRGDVSSPSIRVWEDVLTEDYQYSNLIPRPTGGGTKITKEGGQECIDPFTPITFGIETDKPSQCKISFDLKEGYGNAEFDGYDDMEYFFGSSNLYDYFHEQDMKLPSPNALESYARAQADDGEEEGEESDNADEETNPIQGQEFDEDAFEIFNGKEYELYVRCRSPNGYYNPDPYIIKFCVEEGPDLTAPIIEEFNIEDESPVQYGVDNVSIIAYTNEPANCWWSESDKSTLTEFKEQGHEMECENGLGQMTDNLNYACFSELTNVEDLKDNDFYFRCEDQPWEEQDLRNPMLNSEKLTLVGTEALNIKEGSLIPEEGSRVTGSTSTVEVNIEVETQNGYKDGESTCYYSLDEDIDTSAIEFEGETGENYLHTQTIYRPTGTYTLFVKCVDLGGNTARAQSTFEVYHDKFAPVVTRVFHNAGQLEIYTDEESVCYYSTNENTKCNYDISDEESVATTMRNPTSSDKTKHLSDWDTDKNYYIKCKEYTEDDTGRRPLPDSCSIIVKPVNN